MDIFILHKPSYITTTLWMLADSSLKWSHEWITLCWVKVPLWLLMLFTWISSFLFLKIMPSHHETSRHDIIWTKQQLDDCDKQWKDSINHQKVYKFRIWISHVYDSWILGYFNRMHHDNFSSEFINLHICLDSSGWNWGHFTREDLSPDTGFKYRYHYYRLVLELMPTAMSTTISVIFHYHHDVELEWQRTSCFLIIIISKGAFQNEF